MTDTQTQHRPVVVGGNPLRIADVVEVARHGAPVEIGPATLDAVRATRSTVEALARDAVPHYGVSTGFGALEGQLHGLHTAPD